MRTHAALQRTKLLPAYARCLGTDSFGARKFLDRTRILVTAGKGGNGCVSFFRDACVEKGPADGATGGGGGAILLRCDSNISDLHMSLRNYKAENGTHGGSAQMLGRAGKDTEVRIPCGTIVHQVGEVICSFMALLLAAFLPTFW